MRRLKPAKGLRHFYVTRENMGKITYQVRKIHYDKHDHSKSVWVIFKVRDGWSYAVGNTPVREYAYGVARMYREYGCIY